MPSLRSLQRDRVRAMVMAVWGLVAVAAAALVYLVFARGLPQMLGRRCPRDGRLLERTESVVRGLTVDADGLSCPAIIERTYACPLCGFRHVQALTDPTHRAASVQVDAGLAGSQWRYYHLRDALGPDRSEAATEQQFREALAAARRRASEKTSGDSPWRRER